jgi:hypothetical protein
MQDLMCKMSMQLLPKKTLDVQVALIFYNGSLQWEKAHRNGFTSHLSWKDCPLTMKRDVQTASSISNPNVYGRITES